MAHPWLKRGSRGVASGLGAGTTNDKESDCRIFFVWFWEKTQRRICQRGVFSLHYLPLLIPVNAINISSPPPIFWTCVSSLWTPSNIIGAGKKSVQKVSKIRVLHYCINPCVSFLSWSLALGALRNHCLVLDYRSFGARGMCILLLPRHFRKLMRSQNTKMILKGDGSYRWRLALVHFTLDALT